MNKVLLSITFGLLFLFIIVQLQEGHAQSIDPLIDTPGKSIGSDFNGDGIHDFIVGAYGNDDCSAGSDCGAAYIVFGVSGLSGTKDTGNADEDVRILGKAGSDFMGRSVSGVGDVNGDGFDDFIVGADSNNDGGSNNEGAAYIFFGASNLTGTKDLGGGASADVTILGKAAGDSLGIGVSGAGDVNGDGFDDIIVGAHLNDDCAAGINCGAAYIIFGASNLSGTKDMGNADEDVKILGKAGSNQLGRSVSGAGDVNGDGFDDIIVGAETNGDGGASAGAAYIFFGASNLSGTKDTSSADEDVRILGNAASDNLGRSVSGVGDVNGDGFDDIVVGAHLNDDAGGAAGAAYIIFGASNLSGTKDMGNADEDVRILGKAASDNLGRSVSGAGDVNDDGFDDFIVGSNLNDDAGVSNAGAAYILFGASDLSGTKSLGGVSSADVTILGKVAGDQLGRSVSGLGDVNADGFPDVIVGAEFNEDGGANNEGAAYIIFGASNLSGTKNTGSSDEDVRVLGKTVGDFLGTSVGGGRSNPGP